MEMEGDICRICFEGGFWQGEGLIQPCHCTGSIAKVHRHCLQAWLGFSGRRVCDLCQFPYQTRTVLPGWKEFVKDPANREYLLDMVAVSITVIFLTLALILSAWFGVTCWGLVDRKKYWMVTICRMLFMDQRRGTPLIYCWRCQWGEETWGVWLVRNVPLAGWMALSVLLSLALVSFCWRAFIYHGLVWRRWRRINQRVTVVSAED